MTQRTSALLEIQRELNRLDEDDLQKAKEYVHGLAARKRLNVESLGGIWKGLGFEDMDIEAEVRSLRTESEQQILNRARDWNS